MAFIPIQGAAILTRAIPRRANVLLRPVRVNAPTRRLCARVWATTTAPLRASAKAIQNELSAPEALRGNAEDMATRYDPTALEGAIYDWWERAGYFAPVADNGKEPFVICMPPPNVTGNLHMGHAMFVAVEDILTRYARMTGRPTLYLPGMDHAGIATQLVVAKQLASEGVEYRELSREKFNQKVWEWKEQKGGYISKQLRKLGASCDWNREKFTLDESMCEAVNEAFLRLHDQGLIYRGDYMVNWSPGLQTAVSDIEVDFSEEVGKLYYFRYPVEGGGEIPVATTRPETILGDTAVCVHPDDTRYRHLIGWNAVVPVLGRKIRIIADEYVDREFGTGALKITPGHDTNDYDLGKKHGLNIVNIMNRDATLNENAGPFEGLDRFVAREKLWEQLSELGLAIKVEEHISRVPRSQRGGEIVEPLVSTQWFVRMEGLAESALEAVRDRRIKIIPERFEKVYYNWLENIKDWCISRQLMWGHQIPVWNVVERQGEYIVARDVAHAEQQAIEKYGVGVVTLSRETDVLDTWFSSGLWPFATMGWPQKDAADIDRFFPGTVMETGYDIIFFWVARMIMLSIGLTGKIPFETVYLHGLVRDAEGRKMSKSTGNVLDPLGTIAEYGTDALRYSLVTGSTPGQDIPLSVDKIESNRNFANKLWNACRYILTNLEGVTDIEQARLSAIGISNFGSAELPNLPLPERYIVSRLHTLVASVTTGLDSFAFGDAGRQIYEFLWDEFAAWYLEASKARLYGDDAQAAATARATLVYVMDSSLRLLHPFMPFVTEALWQRFPRSDGEELALIAAQWPQGGIIDSDAVERFARCQALVRTVRNARAEYDVEQSKRVPISVFADKITAGDIEDEKRALALLAKIDSAQFDVHVDDCGAATVGQEEDEFLQLNVEQGLRAVIPLCDMIDYEKERLRLEKQIGRVQKDLDGLKRRLNAPGFAEKAPAEIVNAAKENAGNLDSQLHSLNERLATVLRMAG